MWLSGQWTVCAYRVAGRESLLQTAGSDSHALWRVPRIGERGGYSRRSRKRFASEMYEARRDARVLTSGLGVSGFWFCVPAITGFALCRNTDKLFGKRGEPHACAEIPIGTLAAPIT